LYATRHIFAPHLLTMGAPITYVAAQLGHAKPTMTLARTRTPYRVVIARWRIGWRCDAPSALIPK
jgi:hypothetical protein